MLRFTFVYAFVVCLGLMLTVNPLVGQDEDDRLDERVYSRNYRSVDDSTAQKRPMGKITVYEDERIKALDKLKMDYPGKRDGYRVQIFFGDRQKALKHKASFTTGHPGVSAYISYLAPNFRLRVGDFRTRMEGEKLKKDIESRYPGCYLVKDKIELPPLEKDADDRFGME